MKSTWDGFLAVTFFPRPGAGGVKFESEMFHSGMVLFDLLRCQLLGNQILVSML